jgi:hypothetical protein
MNLSYRKLQLKIRWNLFITLSKLKLSKNIKLKINNTLSEIDNLILLMKNIRYIIAFTSNAIKFTNG